ncbi:MAG: hypothetical protein WDN50_13135 [Bradyrhizobium sp.]
MNELAMNLTAERVDDGYLKVLIISQAISVKVLCEDPAMCDRIGIALEFQPDSVAQRDAVFHIKEKFLHSSQPRVVRDPSILSGFLPRQANA